MSNLQNNTRELCLVLDKEGYKRLTLIEGTPYEVDHFTSKFEDSIEIRKKFSRQIEDFLTQNKNFIDSLKTSKNGRIVVVDKNQIGNDIKLYQKRVMYKKFIKVFNKIRNLKEVNVLFIQNINSKKLLTQFERNQLRFKLNKTENQRKQAVDLVLRENKVKKTGYYEIIRAYLYAYEKLCFSSDNYLTVDQIYEEIKEEERKKQLEKKLNSLADKEKEIITKEVNVFSFPEREYFIINGQKLPLDELTNYEPEDFDLDNPYAPDVLGRKK